MKQLGFKSRVLESGASMVEYIICLAILIGVFLAASEYLQEDADQRTNTVLNMAETTLPCEAGLSPDQCK